MCVFLQKASHILSFIEPHGPCLTSNLGSSMVSIPLRTRVLDQSPVLGMQTQKRTLKEPDIKVVMETHGAKVKDKEVCNLAWTLSGGKIHQLRMDMGAEILMPVYFSRSDSFSGGR